MPTTRDTSLKDPELYEKLRGSEFRTFGASFGGSFSAGSAPIFASKYAFFSIFKLYKKIIFSRANSANF